MFNLLSHVQLFVTPRTIPHKAPLFMGILQARILEWVSIPSSSGSSQSRDFTQVSCIADSLSPEPPGKPNNNGVGFQSLFQVNLLTQESNQGLLHGRQILYQLSYQGSPWIVYSFSSYWFFQSKNITYFFIFLLSLIYSISVFYLQVFYLFK